MKIKLVNRTMSEAMTSSFSEAEIKKPCIQRTGVAHGQTQGTLNPGGKRQVG
jgi:hypothetical protein